LRKTGANFLKTVGVEDKSMKDNSLAFNRVSFVLTLKKHSQKVLLNINYYSPIKFKSWKNQFLKK